MKRLNIWQKLVATLVLAGLCVSVYGLFTESTKPADAQTFVRSGSLSRSWTCSLQALVASLTQCQAVPSDSTDRHYITDIVVQTTTATSGTFQIRSGTGSNCATSATVLFPGATGAYNAPINSQPMAQIHFITPLRPPAGDAICVIGTATNTIDIQLQGFVAR